MDTKTRHCEFCWPLQRKNHLLTHCDYYLSRILFHSRFFDWLWAYLLDLLIFFRFADLVDEPDESRLQNRSLLFFHEAKKRGIAIKAVRLFGVYVQEFALVFQEKRYYYQSNPLLLLKKPSPVIDQKNQTKIRLQKYGIPVAKGRAFTNGEKAFAYGCNLGFPLVVKPCNGSLSHHATYPVTSEDALGRAIRIAKQYAPGIIVESYVAGRLYRASVIGHCHVFVCQKLLPSVIGDGTSTVAELIQRKNIEQQRAVAWQKNATLHAIPIHANLIQYVRQQGLTLDSILEPQQDLILHDRFVLSHGCEVDACTRLVHPANKKLFLTIAKLLDVPLIGIDFICPDIARSYHDQTCAVLETNSLPYVDMHQYPSQGIPDPVAEKTWNVVLEVLKKHGESSAV